MADSSLIEVRDVPATALDRHARDCQAWHDPAATRRKDGEPRRVIAPVQPHNARPPAGAAAEPPALTAVRRVAIVGALTDQVVDGIRDHTELLQAHLAAGGIEVDVHLRRAGGWVVTRAGLSTAERHPALGDYDAVVLQYNPFLYGRWGVAPWLPVLLGRARMAHTRPVTAVIVHEPFVPMTDAKSVLMGAWQRAQLRALALSANVMLCSTEAWVSLLDGWRPRRRVIHLPVPSNLPDMRACRADARRAIGAGDGDLVLATFGTDHPSHLQDPVERALEAVAPDGSGRVFLTELGARTPRSVGGAGITVRSPGYQTSGELARELSAADIFLAPFIDGVSTRRGTMMAALQHGLPIVGTRGPAIDTALAGTEGALRLVPVGRPDLFAGAVAEVAQQPSERRRMAQAARSLYEQRFDWPVSARSLMVELGVR
jgi:glycosyltransferase involved in cell wall biosynthesis